MQLKSIFLRSRNIILFILLSAITICNGQQKRYVTPEDYPLWSRMEFKKVSDNGNWVYIQEAYEAADTLKVIGTNGKKIYHFPGGNKGVFSGESWFACMLPNQVLQTINLNNGDRKNFINVVKFNLTASGKLLISRKDATSFLEIIDLEKVTTKIVKNCEDYFLSPDENLLVAVIRDKNEKILKLFDLKKDKKNHIISKFDDGEIPSFSWHESGNSLVFELKNSHNPNTIYFYQLQKKKLQSFDKENFLNKEEITKGPLGSLLIGKDQKKVFFWVKEHVDEKKEKPWAPQIWRTEDNYLYPVKKELKGGRRIPKLVMWEPETDGFQRITNNELTNAFLSPAHNYALVYNPTANAPQFIRDAEIDLYFLDLKTGQTNLFQKGLADDFRKISLSPKGNFIAYFKDCEWWIYDVKQNNHKQISNTIDTQFCLEDKSSSIYESVKPVFWTRNENLLIRDQYDVWKIDIEVGKIKKLTSGRSQGIMFDIAGLNKYQSPYLTKSNNFLNNDDEFYFTATGSDEKTGIYEWTSHSGLKKLILEDYLFKDFQLAKGSGTLVFVKENYNFPSAMVTLDNNRRQQKFFQINPHQEKFYWGNSELINYKNSKGHSLKGVLLYPANYDSKKSYPLVVEVYQKQSDRLHQYKVPSEYDMLGFNPTNYTSSGYFVLFPDITYEIGKPAESIKDCVLSVIETVKFKVNIDEDGIGLYGHSYGGFETSSLLTQTDIFQTAVAGAGLHSALSTYFSVDGDFKRQSYMWRFEKQQYRMGSSFFENKEGYYKNSPVLQADKINTPLLLWTGEDDFTVPAFNSMEMFLALRRLKRKATLLIYEDEIHALLNKKAQKDLSIKTKNWFDYYLKNKKPEDWIINKELTN